MNLKGIFIILFTLQFILSSCASRPQDRRRLDDFYIDSGITRYFLTDIPDWANFSQTAGCKRQFATRFLNISKIMGSYGLAYPEAVQFQYLFNRMQDKMLANYSREYLPFRDEEKLFFNVSDKIRAKFFPFRPPKFQRINLVWIDPAVGSKKIQQDLVKLMSSPEMLKGHPVFVSLCMNYKGIMNFLKRLGLSNQNVRAIPYEMFSPFDPGGKQIHFFSIYINDVLGKGKKIHLFSPSKRKPLEFKGKFRSIHSY